MSALHAKSLPAQHHGPEEHPSGPRRLEWAAPTHGNGRCPLQLLAAPASLPPYDDELPAGPVLRLVPAAVPVPAGADPDADVETVRTSTGTLGPAQPFAHALVVRLLEVLMGIRPVRQLRRDVSSELYAELAPSLLCSVAGPGRRPDQRTVRSVHVQTRPDGVAEVCATVTKGARAGALALRLEARAGRWTCTELVGV